MTTQFPNLFACAMCGASTAQMVISSSSAFGSDDLDSRPPLLMRETISHWLQECGDCNYTADDISKAKGKRCIRQVMRTDEWQILTLPKPRAKRQPRSVTALKHFNPELFESLRHVPGIAARAEGVRLPNRFLRRAMIEEALGDTRSAARSTLCAAWAADDSGDEGAAVAHRLAAAVLFKRSFHGESDRSEETLSAKLILVDVLRRAKRWDKAAGVVDELKRQQPSEWFGEIVAFQNKLILARDTNCYSQEEVVRAREGPSTDPS